MSEVNLVTIIAAMIAFAGFFYVSVVGVSAVALVTDTRNTRMSTGQIGSILKDLKDNTTWILTGTWKSNLFTNANFNQTDPATFSATINMVMTNGSGVHKHKISDFTLVNVSAQDNLTSYHAVASMTMKYGPIFGIPINIKDYQNNLMSISLEGITIDQSRVAEHFDRTPIYGTFNK